MTIVNELQRIENNIANSYTALEEKGATLPTKQNSDNLASTIANLEIGSSASDEILKGIVEATATDIFLPDNIDKIAKNFFRENYVFLSNSLSSFKSNGVVELGDYALYGHRQSLKTIELPNVKKLGTYALSSGSGAYGDKAGLTSIKLGALEDIGTSAFSNRLNSDSTIDIDFSFNNCVVGTQAFTFYNNPSFDATGIKSLGQRTFANAGQNFKKIWIPKTVETIIASGSSYTLFSFAKTGSAITIYTDVASADEVPSGWGGYWNVSPVTTSTITTVFGATHEDFLNA